MNEYIYKLKIKPIDGLYAVKPEDDLARDTCVLTIKI